MLPRRDEIQIYWLKSFPSAHRHISRNVDVIIEEPEKIPDWLARGIIYCRNCGTSRKSGSTEQLRA
jgi:hypothetical protein